MGLLRSKTPSKIVLRHSMGCRFAVNPSNRLGNERRVNIHHGPMDEAVTPVPNSG